MSRERFRIGMTGLVILSFFCLKLAAQTGEIVLKVFQFTEKKTVKFDMLPSPRLGSARMSAEVKFEEGQFRIKIKYDDMKPAVLFSGDVASYVLWAINREGVPENLGELWVRKDKEDVEFQTGLRNFALIVTAEEYHQVSVPSQMILFQNEAVADPPVPTYDLTFTDLGPAPKTGVDDLGTVEFSGKKPVDLVQAEKLYRLAQRYEAEKYAPDFLQQARIALEQATLMFERDRKDGAQRYSRRSIASSNEAIGLSLRRKQRAELEAEIAQRQAEMAALEERAVEAEKRAQEVAVLVAKVEKEKAQTEAELQSVREQLEKIRSERRQVESALLAMRNEQQRLKNSMAELEHEKTILENEKAELLSEKSDLQGRLQGALSQVADTRESARGFIVNLPDILFDLGQANLKPAAKLVLAKLSGILLLMPDLNLRIEGHTDSTGTPSGNLRLSQKRAESVYDFLAEQGIAPSRMKTAGYGQDRPIVDNSTEEGRQRNRRVEIIIGEGEITE